MTFSLKTIIIWTIQSWLPSDLEVVDYGPNGAVVIDRRIAEALRDLEAAGTE